MCIRDSFRGPDYNITDEINEIKEKHMSKVELQGKSKSWIWTFQRLASATFLKPFSCIGVLYMLTEWCGFNVILVYMITILKESGSSIDPNIGPIVVGSVRFVFAGMYTF